MHNAQRNAPENGAKQLEGHAAQPESGAEQHLGPPNNANGLPQQLERHAMQPESGAKQLERAVEHLEMASKQHERVATQRQRHARQPGEKKNTLGRRGGKGVKKGKIRWR